MPKVEKRELTLPQPFHFVSDDRAEVRQQRQQQEEQVGGAAGPSGSRPEDKVERDLPKRARKSVAYNPVRMMPSLGRPGRGGRCRGLRTGPGPTLDTLDVKQHLTAS